MAMGIDVNRFLAVFFEECEEGLRVLEAGLLELEAKGAGDRELVDRVFRAAHSIKGGSGSFGFSEITNFTHLLETLLDQIRDGKRQATPGLTATLLAGVDVLAVMVDSRRDGRALSEADSRAVIERLEAALEDEAVDEAVSEKQWEIGFKPLAHLLQTGNDPLWIFRELAGMGKLEVCAEYGGVKRLSEAVAEDCAIEWRLRLKGDVSEAAVRDAFDWVMGDCELEVRGEADQAQAVESTVAKVAGPVVVTTTMTGGEGTSLRVSTEKVDSIINLVGELVITQSMLSQFGEQFDMTMVEKLRDGLAQLARNTRELQETVLKIRMLPVAHCFNRFPRLVHDLSVQLGKRVQLVVSGESTEVDKTVLEKINEPLLHLLRNSLDHGLESPEARRAAGKPEMGTVQMNAAHRGGCIVIEVSDDGAGLDTEKILAKAREKGLVGAGEALSKERIEELIFAPGFSTARELTDISGRGVGMDVVRRNIKELGGSIEIDSSRGAGTKFTIRLPLTLAILDGQIVRVGVQTFVVPLVAIMESVQIRQAQVSQLAGKQELYRLRDEYIPIVRLDEMFGITGGSHELESGLLMVVEDNGVKAGLFVDDLLAQQQVVIKSMESNYRRVEGISGATILGDGTVSMILDVPGILSLSRKKAAA